MSKPFAFAGIADRLGKLIPRLASDHDGEVVATVTAIGRTLSGAGLDWHDLTQRVVDPSFDDVIAANSATASPTSSAGRTPEPTTPPTPSEPRNPGFTNREWGRARRQARGEPEKPKREPPPWPTWGTLSHFGKLGMFDVILAEAAFTPAEAEAMAAFHATYYRHQCGATRKATNLFNVACRNLWERGWRPEEAA